MPDFRVIGVAKDVKQGGVDKKTGTELYMLIDQTAVQPRRSRARRARSTSCCARRCRRPACARRSKASCAKPIRRCRSSGCATWTACSTNRSRRPRLLAQLLGGFAGLALLLAAIGTYGVLSYMVAERRREIGIRMALGADQGSVLAQVMKQGLTLTTVGIVVGLAGAFALNRLIASLLFGVQPTDTTTMVAVVATITLVAAVACWLPAWRASRVDPNIVLRDD